MNEPSAAPLVLVDGSSYLYRAFHALPNLVNSRGEPTGAVYGMINMLKRLLKDYDPEYMAVVLDAPGRTFREDKYADYKANREAMPGDLASQIERVKAAIAALGLALLVGPDVEADDVIGTLCVEATRAGWHTLVSTGDKDLAQLVGPQVTLINTMTGVRYDSEAVMARFGVGPELMIDFLALTGDPVDNVPGVPGVGPKTAAKWLAQYGSLDALLHSAHEIQGKAGESLRQALEHLPLYRDLVTVRCDVKLDTRLSDLKRRIPDEDALRALYARLEFKTWLGELGGVRREPSSDHYETILTEPDFERWLSRLQTAPLIALDTETDGLDPVAAALVGLSFSDGSGRAAYLPLGHDYEGAPAQLDRVSALSRLRPLLEDCDRPKVLQNAKFDQNVLAGAGIALAGVRYDTMLESYVLDSTAASHGLDGLALKHLGRKTETFEALCGRGRAQITFDQVDIPRAARYSCEDADLCFQIHERLWPRLAELPRLRALFEEVEMPLVPVLARMERAGVCIDAPRLIAHGAELAVRIAALEQQAHDVAGMSFNLASPAQIQQVLYERLGLPVIKRTPKGQPSTAEEVLQDLALRHALPGVILEHRGLCKLKDTYAEKLPAMVNPRTGRVHTCYHQAVAATGRLSSSDPNLQNIPVRTAEGRRIRDAFVAPPGRRILAADYSQIELRIMAHLSQDPALVAAFRRNADVHRATAAEVFSVAPEAVTEDQRRAAKAINFGLIYGMSAFGLARQLRIDRSEAQAYCDRYFMRYPAVRAFMEEMRQKARAEGYVETLRGRRLYVPDIQAQNQNRRQYAERTAINAPMQGTAADLIKDAMIRVDAWIRSSQAPALMIMQVHDELVFEVDEDAVEEVGRTVRDLMAQGADLSVPIEVDVGVGASWAQAH
ncbi:MAG: DNA polymerase I [Acidiferrobacteraceae bacterium]